VVFEYELPLEGGRRPDVVVLTGGSLAVLEFKSVGVPRPADLDQVRRYSADLSEYHEASHGRRATPILVLPHGPRSSSRIAAVVVAHPEELPAHLLEAADSGALDLKKWLEAPYRPLPTLVAAARQLFLHKPLPHVKRALAARIPETIELIQGLVAKAQTEGSRLLVFLSGVPGSGKTLVGLRLVYERSNRDGTATFLSGNGPLVAVLQDALESRAFVRDLHGYIRTYGINQRTPNESVLVFDEAQRAWDEGYMETKRGVVRSEPELLLDIGERIPEWSALVGLVGEGQHIHSGEEGGMPAWRQAVAAKHRRHRWAIHCSPRAKADFEGLAVESHEDLDLTVSLRTRLAEQLHQWVGLLIEGSLPLAARQAVWVQANAYPMYVTRDLDEARGYVRQRYGENEEKRYGLLASSHAKLLPEFGIDNGFMATSRLNIAKWFNAPPSDARSCCALAQPVTEFGCQGLELDMPILCWGEDLRWVGTEWELRPAKRRYPQQDPKAILRNTYRVLLTRGRDGEVVFVPPAPELDLTEHALLAAGLKPLEAFEDELAEAAGTSGAS
jgi:hypothetical protein